MDSEIKKEPKAINYIRTASIWVICCFMIFITAFLSIESIFRTCDMNIYNAMLENIEFKYDNIILNIIALIIGFFLFFFLRKYIKNIKTNFFTIGLLIWVILIGFLWVSSAQSAPTNDSLYVTRAAYQASVGNYEPLAEAYFKDYFPFQLGYVLYSEVFIRLFNIPEGYYIALEFLNIVFLAVSYLALLKITEIAFKSDMVQKFTTVLLALALQPVLFSTFLYGNIPGFAFAMLSVWMLLLFLEKSRWYYSVLSALFIALSISIKLNNVILLTAIIIVAAVYDYKSKKQLLYRILYIAMALLMVWAVKFGVKTSYEIRSGIDFGNGIPMVSWAAMGMNESDIQPGWYNRKYTIDNYDKNTYDAAEKSIEIINNRIRYFTHNPFDRNEFFYKKAVSQWNEPTYQSIWTNQVRGHYGEMGKIAQFVCETNETDVKGYMNFYQQFIFAFVLLAVVYLFKTKNLNGTLLLLIVLGGFLYHLIFEAKSQYALTYFIIMIPLAAYGSECLFGIIKSKLPTRNV